MGPVEPCCTGWSQLQLISIARIQPRAGGSAGGGDPHPALQRSQAGTAALCARGEAAHTLRQHFSCSAPWNRHKKFPRVFPCYCVFPCLGYQMIVPQCLSQALLRAVRTPSVTFSPSPSAPRAMGWLLPLHAWSLCKGLLGADVTISLLVMFIHKEQLAVLLAF